MKVFKHGVAAERWSWDRKKEVQYWLRENFGPMGERWNIHHDFNLINYEMDEQVYATFILRWE